MEHAWRRAGAAFFVLAAGSAGAQTPSDTQTLRRELDALRADYEARIQALELRLKAAEAALPGAQAAPAAVAAPAAATPAPPLAAVATAVPATATRPALDLSLILSGQYQRSSRDPADYRIRGFNLPVGAELGPGTRGFNLGETELRLAGNVDPWFRGAAIVALGNDNSVSVEEAYVETTSLGKGLTLRGGRFFSNIGYLNAQHRHTWDFVDAPLAYQAMLGTQYGDDGLRLTWLAPTDRYLELSAEVARGRSFPATDTARNGAGMFSLSAHTGDDIGESHSWRAGLSFLRTRASDLELSGFDVAGNPISNAFSGNTRVWIADGVWRWAPGGNARRTNFKLQGEYLHSTREGSMVVDTAGAASPGGFRASQSGWYLQGIYQFMPRWRFGVRTERLSPSSPAFGGNAGLVGFEAGKPRKTSLVLEHAPSEFTRLRLQAAQDRARPGAADYQWLLQYQMSLGAHGAHGF